MADPVAHPTPYPEVNVLVHKLLSDVQDILGDQFVAMYLYGSLATGDFDPRRSDVDFVVVTGDELGDDLVARLQAMHARIAAGDSPWANELEGSYLPRHAMRRFEPANAHYPMIDRGGGLRVQQHHSDSVIRLHILYERGVVVAGPSPRTLIDPVPADELQHAVLDLIYAWWAPMLDDPARLHSRDYQDYAVLTMCRVLYTLQHGVIVSKPFAARWAQATLDARWFPIVEHALAGRDDPPADTLNDTLDFIRFTVERIGQRGIHPQ
ncbi:MAG: hypothetical protein AVDCRST_MAG26-3323 [uncultured Chloroflexia bacterium]|uniref:Adenylyltransferase AadA C-terminal domain-containing protein n=1 Tax=uncultured Chloroflexia bacterium TaxID=1672391 RepID=A0A6J4JGV9_9CHLR|nr:MAG: hypothetical protein AVDCRST_MAG26-3323 [uncultured Chloroflexia bacterium]